MTEKESRCPRATSRLVAGEPVLVVSTRVFRGIARGIQLQVSNQGLVGDEKTGGHTEGGPWSCVSAFSRVTKRHACVVSREFQRGAQVGGLGYMASPECALKR